MPRAYAFGAFGLLFALWRCGPSGPPARLPRPEPSEARAPELHDSGLLDAGPSDGSVESSATSMRLEPLGSSKVEGAPHVEILFPFAEQQIVIPKAKQYPVRVKVEGVPLALSGAGVEIALDDARPRRLLTKTAPSLGELVAEGRELTPGAHWLFLAAIDASGAIARGSGGSLAPFAAVHFWVGERDPNAVPEPGVAVIAPAGTYNGAHAERITLDFLAVPERLGVPEGKARITVSAGGQTSQITLDAWQPYAITGAPSGDLDVQIDLLDSVGNPLKNRSARSLRRITLNRELGAEEHP